MAQICVVNEEDMQIVSWGELVMGLVVLGIVWYGYIVLRYYRKEITGFGKVRKGNNSPVKWRREADENNSDGGAEKSPVRKNDPHGQVHELMQELKLVCAAAVRDQLSKEQMLEAIGLRLSKYAALPAEIKLSITQHIVNEFSLQVKVMATQDEINALW
jgi:hypothetical protein